MPTTKRFDVKDLSLAPEGVGWIAWGRPADPAKYLASWDEGT
jgi:hypothetical protein